MAKYNVSKSEAKRLGIKRVKISGSSKKKSSKKSSSKKATKKIKKYYKEKVEVVKKKAKIETKRLQEDLTNIFKELGIDQTRATEDYIRNISNIEANKAADVEDLNYYVSTTTERTGENLDTSLARESRRFELEGDRINQELANLGRTFSERRPEQLAREESEITTMGIQTEAKRSFQDIARYEATLNRDIELKYGQQEELAETGKERSLEDILNVQREEKLRIKRGKEDIAFGKAIDIKDLSYGKDTDIGTTEQLFKTQQSYEDWQKELYG